jgi:hypothetical protein
VFVDTNPAPTGLTATRTNGSVELTWDSVVVADGYTVYRGTSSGGPYTKLTDPPVTDTSFTDDSPPDGAAFYVVRTVRDGVESENSAEASVEAPLTPVTDLQTFEADGVTANYSGVDDGAPFTIEADGIVENEFKTEKNDYAAVYAEDGLGESGTVIVKIDDLRRDNFLSMAGIIVRNDMTVTDGPEQGFATLFVKTQGSGLEDYVMAPDEDDSGYIEWASPARRGGGFYEFPSWLKLEKDGTTFTGYMKKAEGDDWTEIYSGDVGSANAVQDVGVFAGSGRTDALGLAEVGEFLST